MTNDLFDDRLCDLMPIDGPVDQPTKFDLVINLTNLAGLPGLILASGGLGWWRRRKKIA